MSSLFAPAPAPPTELGRVRILSSHAGVRVSPLQLGAMSIGEAWKDMMGSMDKEQSFKLLDAFYEAGMCSPPTTSILFADTRLQEEISSTLPITTRMRSLKNGLANGWLKGRIATTWLSLQSSQLHIRALNSERPVTALTSSAITEEVCTSAFATA